MKDQNKIVDTGSESQTCTKDAGTDDAILNDNTVQEHIVDTEPKNQTNTKSVEYKNTSNEAESLQNYIEQVSEYEKNRQNNIRERNQLFDSLDFSEAKFNRLKK